MLLARRLYAAWSCLPEKRDDLIRLHLTQRAATRSRRWSRCCRAYAVKTVPEEHACSHRACATLATSAMDHRLLAREGDRYDGLQDLVHLRHRGRMKIRYWHEKVLHARAIKPFRPQWRLLGESDDEGDAETGHGENLLPVLRRRRYSDVLHKKRKVPLQFDLPDACSRDPVPLPRVPQLRMERILHEARRPSWQGGAQPRLLPPPPPSLVRLDVTCTDVLRDALLKGTSSDICCAAHHKALRVDICAHRRSLCCPSLQALLELLGRCEGAPED
mmetsp:Transcript_60699/g.130358  ORF Transcript_60699/g.130358 Transcript_60699/m.130358 type:complete len:274 (+) Transcript_60699:1278-2099(+)